MSLLVLESLEGTQRWLRFLLFSIDERVAVKFSHYLIRAKVERNDLGNFLLYCHCNSLIKEEKQERGNIGFGIRKNLEMEKEINWAINVDY